jgi:hypothetical protein
MTIQSLWTGPIVAGKDGTRLSFWRRVVTAIAEGRQKKADAIVKEYLQRRAENQDRNKQRWAPTQIAAWHSMKPQTRGFALSGRLDAFASDQESAPLG